MSIDQAGMARTPESHQSKVAYFPSKEHSELSVVQFNQRVNLSEQLTSREDIVKILHDFARQYANDALYDAAYMVDLADRLNDQSKRSSVLHAINTYTGAHENPQKDRYVISILDDVETMNSYIEQSEIDFIETSTDSAQRIAAAIDYKNFAQIPHEVWDKDAMPPDLRKLADLAEGVNLEAVLVKAAQMLQLLKNPVTPGAERMRTVLAIESTYAPLCELSGFDALAALLLSEANCARLAHSDGQKYIDAAREYMEQMGDNQDVETFIEAMPTVLLGESDHEAIVDSATGYGVYFSHSHSDADALIGRDNRYVDSVSRAKTIGAIARKIQYYHRKKGLLEDEPSEMPADGIGMTIIADDTESVGLLLENTLGRLRSINGLEFVNAPSRDELLQLKGSKGFIDSMSTIVESTNPELTVKPDNHNGGFEAVKITVEWPMTDKYGVERRLPVEVQITHREARNNTRTGIDSHTLFKLRKYGGDENSNFLNSTDAIDCLKRIRARKDKLLENVGYGMNERSYDNSEALYQEVLHAVPVYDIGKKATTLSGI